MFQLPYNGEDILQLAHEMAALGLPGFLGVAKLTRELDQNNRVILVSGKPKIVAAYLLIKSATLSSAEEAAATTVVSNHVPALKRERNSVRTEFINEGLVRISSQVPDWNTIEAIKTVAGIWPAISSSASPAMLLAKDIYIYIRNTVPSKLAAVITKVELDAIDPTTTDPFGDGTPWPT